MTSEFELDLYFMMLYPSVKFERNCCIPSKFIDRKPQIDKPKSKKGHNSIKSFRMTSEFELDLYFMMLYPSVKFERNCCIPSKFIDRKPQIDNVAKILSQKRTITHSKFCWLTPFQTWPVFHDYWPFCGVWMKLMHPFKSYWSETKSVTSFIKSWNLAFSTPALNFHL